MPTNLFSAPQKIKPLLRSLLGGGGGHDAWMGGWRRRCPLTSHPRALDPPVLSILPSLKSLHSPWEGVPAEPQPRPAFLSQQQSPPLSRSAHLFWGGGHTIPSRTTSPVARSPAHAAHLPIRNPLQLKAPPTTAKAPGTPWSQKYAQKAQEIPGAKGAEENFSLGHTRMCVGGGRGAVTW